MARKNDTTTPVETTDKLDAAIAGCEAMQAEAVNRREAYEAVVEANRNARNQARQARLEAVKAKMAEGKSMPQIAAELQLTYRQVKHVAWYIQHPEVAMPTS